MKVLVLCTGNSCRSQMAHGYLQFFAGSRADVYSAGVETHGVNPKAVEFMMEDGIDISHHTSNHVSEYFNLDFDYILTVCDHAKETCPYFPSRAKRLHYNFPDPSKFEGDPEETRKEFRRVRNLIKSYCLEFVQTHIP